MFGEIASAISIFDRIKSWLSLSNQTRDENTLTERFISLFEKHGVHKNQIPRFFDHGIELEDINNEDKLLPKLTHEILQSASDLFAVRLEWLEGVDDQLYETHDFYKQPGEYGIFLSQLKNKESQHLTTQLVLSSARTSGNSNDALLIIEEKIGTIGDKNIVRYHLCSGWVHSYWKCRADLAVCIAMTLKQRVFIRGSHVKANIEHFCSGEGFISDLYQMPSAYKRNWLLKRKFHHWHPDEWIYEPTSFVDGIDEGDFGKANALARWLDYFDKQMMETGYNKADARDQFSALLKTF